MTPSAAHQSPHQTCEDKKALGAPMSFRWARQITSLLGAVALVLAQAGCGGGSSGTAVSENPPTTDEPITVREVAPETVAALAGGGRAVMTELLVTTDEGVTKDAAASLFAKFGFAIVGRVPEANLYQVALPSVASEADLVQKRDQLASEPGVLSASLNLIPEAQSTVVVPGDPRYGEQEWAFKSMNALEAWGWLDEKQVPLSEVKVGVIDTGFVPMKEKKPGELKGEMEFERTYGPTGLQTDAAAAPPPIKASISPSIRSYEREWSEHHHGMHVAGIIGATGGNNQLGAGLAWQAPISLYAARRDSSASVLAHIARMARDDVRVINISLGYSKDTPQPYRLSNSKTFAFLVESLLKKKDFLLVFAAGNETVDASIQTYLGHLFNPDGTCMGLERSRCERLRGSTLIVGANGSEKDGDNAPRLAGYSNFGAAVQLVAPGGDGFCIFQPSANDPQMFSQNRPAYIVEDVGQKQVSACTRMGVSSLGADGTRILMSGTSQAAPFVTGAAALLFSANKDLSSAQVKDLLISKSTKMSRRFRLDGSEAEEYPTLNLNASLEAALLKRGTPITPREVDQATYLLSIYCRYSKDSDGKDLPGIDGIKDVPVDIQRRLSGAAVFDKFFSDKTNVAGVIVAELVQGEYRVSLKETPNSPAYVSEAFTINPAAAGGSVKGRNIYFAGTSVSDCGGSGKPTTDSFSVDDTPVFTLDAILAQGGFGNLGGWNGACAVGSTGCTEYFDVDLTLGGNGTWRDEIWRSQSSAAFIKQPAQTSDGWTLAAGGWVPSVEGGTYAAQADGSVLVTGSNFGSSGAYGQARVLDLAGQPMSVVGETASVANFTFPAGAQGYLWSFLNNADTYHLRTENKVSFFSAGLNAQGLQTECSPATLAALVACLQSPAAGQAGNLTWGWNGLEFSFDGALANQGAVSFWSRTSGALLGRGQYELRDINGQQVLVVIQVPDVALTDAAARDSYILDEYGGGVRPIFGVVNGAVYSGTINAAGTIKHGRPGLNMTALNAVLAARGLCTLPAPNGSGVCPPAGTGGTGSTLPPVPVGVVPATPTGVAPGNTTAMGVLVGSTKLFSWAGSAGATDFEVVFFDVAANSVYSTVRVSSTSFLLGAVSLVGGQHVYGWKVAACNSTGCSPYTPELRFRRQ